MANMSLLRMQLQSHVIVSASADQVGRRSRNELMIVFQPNFNELINIIHIGKMHVVNYHQISGLFK